MQPLNPVLFKQATPPPPKKPGQVDDPRIYLALPSGRGAVGQYIVSAACQSIAHRLRVTPLPVGNSSTTHNFNVNYCAAYNERRTEKRPDGFTHFAMLHDDVQPLQPDWLERMYAILSDNELDVLSAVIAIKDERGITSTGLDTHLWCPRRLTLHEIHKRMPSLITNRDIPSYFGDGPNQMQGPHANLIINTGLMLMRLDRPWNSKVVFQFRNETWLTPDGILRPEFEPEDWRFSRFLARHNAHFGATRDVSALHHGNFGFPNDAPWGTQKWDAVNIQDTDELYGVKRPENTSFKDVGRCEIPSDDLDR